MLQDYMYDELAYDKIKPSSNLDKLMIEAAGLEFSGYDQDNCCMINYKNDIRRFCPSFDIRATYLLIELLKGQPDIWSIQPTADCYNVSTDFGRITVSAITLELAVCRAIIVNRGWMHRLGIW